MKPLLLVILFPCLCYAPPPPGFADKMADAIYRAEGGSKTRWPYGVKSVKVSGEAEARRVTINSVNNNWRRWEQANKPVPFVQFMALRWCPPSADPVGHTNWVRNVTKFLSNNTNTNKL